ncbi:MULTISPECIES: hypothetical protein [Carnobacterium]|uniref:Uncharacterized protein n=1 Tax=Carnobacterium inhibens TaxID=147709 RepID=A0ABR7TEB1_9LACT|nr:hypothetical protein [Carnobacterium inhibens]MBC9825701.1 hypothetical protein [Carnobacterium inhibens]MCM3513352.1 hypothetical protein [Carnobacterium inhibens]
MLIDINDNFFNELQEVSDSLNITIGEYLENLHEKNQKLKMILLEDKEGFEKFLKEYHVILDDLVMLNPEALAILNENSNPEIMKPVFIQLLKIANGDISVLTKLYDTYLKQSQSALDFSTAD